MKKNDDDSAVFKASPSAAVIADIWIKKLAYIHEDTSSDVIAEGLLFGTFSGKYSWHNPVAVSVNPPGYYELNEDILFRVSTNKDMFSYVDNDDITLTHIELGMYIIPENYKELYIKIKKSVLEIIDFMYDQCDRNVYTDIYPIEYNIKNIKEG